MFTLLRSLTAAAAALCLLGAAHAQQQPDFSKVEIKTTPLADNLYLLEGQGGTISALTGPEGVLLVDAQFAPLTDKLAAAVRKVSNQPIRFLVNTHVHGDHTGGNANFAKLGATLLSRDELRDRLARPRPNASGVPGQPAPAQALPTITYDGPVTVHLNGEDVRLIPIRGAHTDGDTLVQFVRHDVLATGDYYRSTGYPVVDLINGGTLKGLVDGLGATIALAGPRTKIVPGHGPVVDRAALVAHRDLLLAVRDKVIPLVAQGKTVDEVIAARPTADFDAQVPQAAQTSERFIRWLYADLKAAL